MSTTADSAIDPGQPPESERTLVLSPDGEMHDPPPSQGEPGASVEPASAGGLRDRLRQGWRQARRWGQWALRSRLVQRLLKDTDWAVGLLVVLALATLSGTDSLRRLEWGAYDFSVWASPSRPANKDVVVVGIDDASLERIGPWPWSRYLLAEVNAIATEGGARVVGYLPSFDAAQNVRGLEILHWLQDEHANAFSGNGKRLLRQAERKVDTDQILAATFARTANVVLAVPYHTRTEVPGEVPALPEAMGRQRLRSVAAEGATARSLPGYMRPEREVHIDRLHLPIEPIREAAVALSIGMERPQVENAIRSFPLVHRYGDAYLPSFPLMVAVQAGGTTATAVRVEDHASVLLQGRPVPTDAALRAFPVFYKGQGASAPFEVYSFADVHQGQVPKSEFEDKIVLVGTTATNLAEPLNTPIDQPLMPVVAMAHMVSSLLNGDLHRMPEWQGLGRALAFLGVALYLMLVLPRLRLGTGVLLTGLLLVLVLNVQFFLMILESVWLPLMVPALALVTGHLLLTTKNLLAARTRQFQADLSSANFQLGMQYHAQGQYDAAFRHLRRCAPEDAVFEQLYFLGLDYERKRKHARAAEVFGHIAASDPTYKDVAERVHRNEDMVNAFLFGGGDRRSGGGTLVIKDDTIEKPMLGRYQIEREIGKGAMGVVYLGRDPKIGRVVAIKTLNLGQEFQEDDVADIKERFLREAETAGRLNHPNIVTIYDVGEEQDLAYIAMDYLEGKPLDHFTKPDNLLPMEHVFIVGIQVAEALAAAHAQNVVHRDIKPANIIYDRRKGVAKVTDFGVACLTDTSKTRTGTILGTPSFMSPEQLEGRKISGHSDMFSLGVTLYQLLTGELPFEADSLSTLMYRIINEKHKDVRIANPQLPQCASTLIDRSLQKDPLKRYENGKQMAASLRRCLKQISGG